MKQIPLTQGKFALVSDEDFDYLNQWNWCFVKGYAVRRKGKFHTSMHREIMNTPQDKDTDHINHDKLDNRRSNLRICNRSQNTANSRKLMVGTSKYKGVRWAIKSRAWQVRIRHNGEYVFIGEFKNERHAGMAYALWSKDVHGAFAYTQF